MKDFKALYGDTVRGLWPYILAKNASGAGAEDGTPYDSEFINTLWGFIQAVMNETGTTPNGQTETATYSQIWNAMKDFNYPVGSLYIQHMNDPSPIERGLPGFWEAWSHRADGYGLTSGTLPSFRKYKQGDNFAQGEYMEYHVLGSHRQLFQAKEAISGAPLYMDPVKWTKFTPGIIVERRHLQKWTDKDFAIGDKILTGTYSGWSVSEVITPGGTFPSVEGGHRPPFVTGGVAGDMIREIFGCAIPFGTSYDGTAVVANGTGAFFNEGRLKSGGLTAAPGEWSSYFKLSASRVVPVGPENAPQTKSDRWYRRVV